MASRKVIMMDNELLRKKSKPVVNFDEGLWELLDDMRETMIKNDGMGLAAVQVGVLRRAICMLVNGAYIELVNPKIISTEGEDIGKEGCLSCDVKQELVKRPMTVTVKAQDRYGYDFTLTGEKSLARCICHECDHLEGILFVDKIYKEKK